MSNTDPFRPVDETARQLARDLIASATYGALAVLRPDMPAPSVSRIAIAADENGTPFTLISTLADHTRALQANPVCAVLLGAPGPTGDPLTHPRLTLHANAVFVARGTDEHDRLRAHFLKLRPKSKLYVDFTDFGFVRFRISDGLLSGGFGKAWRLAPSDIWPDHRTT
ncbi:HugZ family protein [Ruegeria sp. HKCCD7221]|uniref:HugZ family pyridoxamine 5'-phosphate oxidase n=1 Tax=Ruegeria sp. HKCCD7221 TaxID=2683009 RepID=UPI00148904C0|nr:pyridoxamine 5'-phosphate oxidase family protein [Ruegeria sp. HKCCD7221]